MTPTPGTCHVCEHVTFAERRVATAVLFGDVERIPYFANLISHGHTFEKAFKTAKP